MASLSSRSTPKRDGVWHGIHIPLRGCVTVVGMFLLLQPLLGCSGLDCEPNTQRCVGDVRQYCQAPCSDFCAVQWSDAEVCDGACIENGGGAMCVLSSKKDPRCQGVDGYCDGDVSISCADGYAVRREACSGSANGGGDPAAHDGGTPSVPQGTCVVTGPGSSCVVPPVRCSSSDMPNCGAPAECGPVVTAMYRAGELPQAKLGSISDGLYLLTELYVYGGSVSGPSFQVQESQSIAGGTFAISQYRDRTPNYASGTYSVQVNGLLWKPTCAVGIVGNTSPIAYTATASTLVLYEPYKSGLVYELIYQRQ